VFVPRNDQKPKLSETTLPDPVEEPDAALAEAPTEVAHSEAKASVEATNEVAIPTVKVKLAPDFEADGDVFVSVPELPEDLSDGDDRLKISKDPIEVPATVAALLVESPAVVEVAE
jgi:hypothetical protein